MVISFSFFFLQGTPNQNLLAIQHAPSRKHATNRRKLSSERLGLRSPRDSRTLDEFYEGTSLENYDNERCNAKRIENDVSR